MKYLATALFIIAKHHRQPKCPSIKQIHCGNGILFHNKKEQVTDTYNNMDELKKKETYWMKDIIHKRVHNV